MLFYVPIWKEKYETNTTTIIYRGEDKFEKNVEKLNSVIQKINKLEQTAGRSSSSERSSTREKLENNKAMVKARDSSEPKHIREKQQPEAVL